VKRRPQRELSTALIVWSVALFLAWGSLAEAADAAPSRRAVSETGEPVHFFLAPDAEAAFRASLPADIAGNTTTNMTNHGGLVSRSPIVYLIFWTPPGGAAFPAGYQAAMQQFFHDVSGTPHFNILTQYGDSTGVAVPNAEVSLWGGTYIYTAAFPRGGTTADPLLDSDIRTAISAAITANPTWNPPGVNTMYFLFTAPGVAECFEAAKLNCFAQPGQTNGKYCAYHSFYNTNRVYAFMPYAPGGNCFGTSVFPNGSGIDVELSVVAHEFFEAHTDPFLDAWYETDLSGEIGDKCAYTYGFLATNGENIMLWRSMYQVQREWSNKFTGCVKQLSYPTPQRDFNGDGSSDILWQNASDGHASLWPMNGGALLSPLGDLGLVAGWTPTIGDFNGDGMADILWQKNSDGHVNLWLSVNGSNTLTSTTTLSYTVIDLGFVAGWTPVVGDFNGDGKSDILWQKASDGHVSLWFMNGGALLSPPVDFGFVAGWAPVVGDFNGDGKSDVLWQKASDGRVNVWLMNGGALLSPPVDLGFVAGWAPVVGDFNGDGKSDILWQKASDGHVSLWFMTGGVLLGLPVDLGFVAGWTPKVGDFNADGYADILWQKASDGHVNLWLMRTGAIISGGNLDLGFVAGWAPH